MPEKSETEQKARAERFRKQIDTLTHTERNRKPETFDRQGSITEFVHRRMQELDKAKE